MKPPINTFDITIPREIINKWQSVVDIMAEIIDVSAALIMKVEPPYIEVFRFSESSNNPYKAGNRGHLAGLYHERVILKREKLLVPNALKDGDWNGNPDIKLGMISYLGFPLLWPDGEVFGTICVLDSKQNSYGERYEKLMLQFKEVIEAHLALLYQAQLFNNQASEVKRIEEKYRALVEQSLLGLAIVQDNKIVFANSATAEILGYTFEELISLSPQETMALVYPEDQEFVWGRYRDRLEGKTVPRRYEYRVIRKDGTERWVEMFSRRIEYQGKPAVQAAVLDITEGKEAGEALRESEERFRLAFENANIGMCLVDIDGRLTKVNRQMCETFGYSQEELEGMTVNDIAHPEDLDISPQFIQRSLSGEVEYTQFEKRYFHKQGHIVWGQVSSSLVRDSQAAPRYFISHVQNISERKQVEEELQESEERFRTSVTNTPIGLSIIGKNGTYEYVNPKFVEMFGYTPEDVPTGKEWFERAYPDPVQRQKVIACWIGDLKEAKVGETRPRVFTVTCKDGSKKEIFFRPVSLTDRRQLVTYEDITERVRTEEELRERESKLQSIFRAAPIGIGVVIDRIISQANDRFCEMTGYTNEELIGKTARDLYPTDEEYEYVGKEKYAQIQKHGRGTVETRLKRKDGKIIDVLLSSTPIDPTDLSAGVTFTALDITERKRAEEELRAAEEKYRVLVENASEGVIVAQDDMLRFVNPKTIEITGYSKEELTSRPFVGFIHPDDRKIVVERHLRRLKGEEVPDVYPFRIIDKEGNIKWLEINAVLINWEGRPATLNFLTDITERKRAEERLQQSEEKYRTLVEHSLQGLNIIQGIPPRLVFVNSSMAEIFGYTVEEVLSLSAEETRGLVHPEDQGFVWERYRDRLAGKTVLPRYEYRGVRQDGTVRWVEVFSSRIEYRGEPAVQAALVDITERKRAEEVLRESEEKFRNLAEQSPNMIFINKKGRVVYANKKCEDIMGYNRDEFYSPDFDFLSLMAPESIELIKSSFARHMKGEEIQPYEYSLVTKDGERIEAILNTTLINYQRETAILGTVTDITERKRADQRLREYEARYSHLLDHMPDGVALVQRGRIIRVNPPMARMFGFPSPEKIEGLYIWDLAAHGSKGIMRQQSTLRALAQQGKNRFEFQALRKDGRTFPAEVTFTVDRSELRPFVLSVIRDVTERKTYENQRKLLSDRIITAGERERALIARELHDELGQALTGIKIDMIWIRSHVKGIDTAVSDRFNALEELINTTIETVRKMAASLRPSMLDQLGLAAAIEWYAGEFERRTGIECIIESETPDFSVNKKTAINAYRIYQEALTNVARHAKASRVDVRIDQDRGYLTLCISDNGRGIPSERLSGPISLLGIAGMRERAELVKGRLDIRSQRGKGTEVTAYLPLSPQRG